MTGTQATRELPSRTPVEIGDEFVELRKRLLDEGLGAGARTIASTGMAPRRGLRFQLVSRPLRSPAPPGAPRGGEENLICEGSTLNAQAVRRGWSPPSGFFEKGEGRERNLQD